MDDGGVTDDEVAALADALIALATRPEPLPNPRDEAMAEALVAAFRAAVIQVSAIVKELAPLAEAILSVRRARLRAMHREYARRQKARRRRRR